MSTAQAVRSSRAWWRTTAGLLVFAALSSSAVAWWLIAWPVLSFGNEPRHAGHFGVLYFHALGGTIMLFLGAVNLYIGATRTRFTYHVLIGRAYLIGGLPGVAAAVIITTSRAHKSDAGVLLTNTSISLLTLSFAWLAASLMAYRAARNRRFDSHRDWMVRSYVLVWAFVFCRLASRVQSVDAMGGGTAFIWLSWIGPLIVGEIALQWRAGARLARAGLVVAMVVGASGAVPSAQSTTRGPIIDMHLHAWPLELPAGTPGCPGDQPLLVPTIDPRAEFDPSVLFTCDKPLRAPASDDALMRESIAELARLNVRRAVAEGAVERVATWKANAPASLRLSPAVGFANRQDLPIEELRRLHREGRLEVFAEVATQYRGVRADDPRWEPYFALAEELDIPVGIHLGEGPPAAARFPGYEDYRASLTSPFQLEDVLRRHPRLRIWVMHYASPLVDEMIAMMFTHPNLYVDVACNDWSFPRAQFHDALKRMVDAGFVKRILFGSDSMYWPGAIGEAVEAIDEAPFLDGSQKRDIFYDNAARFLRLTPEQIAADHR